MRVSIPRTSCLGEQQVVRGDLGADPEAARLGGGDRLDRGGAAEVLEVHARVLVAGERGVARDHRRLADGRDAGDAERRADGALVHRAAARERRVLLVQREHAAAQALVLQRLAQHRRRSATGLPSSVKPSAPSLGELGHLGQLLALAGRA